MADLAELKQMVLSFRVSELHVLLGFAGRNKSGRKQELTQRALALVQKNCSLPVQIKIRELYRQIYPVTKGQPTAPQNTKDINMPVMHRHQGMLGYPTEGAVGLDYSAMGSMRPIISQAPIPVNPDVKLKHLPFYDVLGELMKPSSLIPKNSGRMQETLFVFHLTPQQAQDITLSRDYRPGAKVEYNVQVQLRFCLLETTSEQADTFPSQIQVRVNNKPATLPNVIPTNKPNVEPKRPGRPVDITSLCRLSPTVSNAITVSWATDFTRPKPIPLHNKAAPKAYGSPLDVTYLCKLCPTKDNIVQVAWSDDQPRSFCMAIYLVSKLSSEILLQRLKQFGNRHSDHTKALIKEKLEQDPDSEISTTSLRVSLMCPLGKMRMQIPCRASTCTHLQCFDAMTFLKMNERKPTWMCPVCDRQCPYDKLIIDGYFVEILRKCPAYSEINFHEDGTWTPVTNKKESSKQVNLSTNNKSPSSSSSSSSSSSLNNPQPSVTATPMTMSAPSYPASMPPAPAAKPPSSSKGPVIDLTLDSSDDDDDDDAVIPSDPVCISPSPVINLDTPSPAPLPPMPGSPTVLLSNSSSPSPVAAHSSHNHNGHSSNHFPQQPQPPQAHSSSSSYHVPPHNHSSSGYSSNSNSGSSSNSSSASNHNSASAPSPIGSMDSILRHSPPSLSNPPPPSSSSTSASLNPALNLEAMSDADFDEFLKGLSWGV